MKIPFSLIVVNFKKAAQTRRPFVGTELERCVNSAECALGNGNVEESVSLSTRALALIDIEAELPPGPTSQEQILHFIRGCAYRELDRLEDAKAELAMVASSGRYGIARSARKLLASM